VRKVDQALEDAITHAKHVARTAPGRDCKDQHRQLASWLLELKYRRIGRVRMFFYNWYGTMLNLGISVFDKEWKV